MRAIERTHFSAALNALRCAVLLTDANGKIIHINKSAEQMLQEATAIKDQRGFLKAVLALASRELSEAIRLAANEGLGIGKKGVAVRLSEDGSFPVLAHVLPLTTGDLRTRFEPAAAAAVFIRNRESARDSAEVLAATYELTPAETRVLSCLLSGRTVGESARELRVGVETVRTHLDGIFRKTGVGRQQDLLLLASQLSPPISLS